MSRTVLCKLEPASVKFSNTEPEGQQLPQARGFYYTPRCLRTGIPGLSAQLGGLPGAWASNSPSKPSSNPKNASAWPLPPRPRATIVVSPVLRHERDRRKFHVRQGKRGRTSHGTRKHNRASNPSQTFGQTRTWSLCKLAPISFCGGLGQNPPLKSPVTMPRVLGERFVFVLVLALWLL